MPHAERSFQPRVEKVIGYWEMMEGSSRSEMPLSMETGLPMGADQEPIEAMAARDDPILNVDRAQEIEVGDSLTGQEASFRLGDGPLIPMNAILVALDPSTQNAITAVYWRLAYLSSRPEK